MPEFSIRLILRGFMNGYRSLHLMIEETVHSISTKGKITKILILLFYIIEIVFETGRSPTPIFTSKKYSMETKHLTRTLAMYSLWRSITCFRLFLIMA